MFVALFSLHFCCSSVDFKLILLLPPVVATVVTVEMKILTFIHYNKNRKFIAFGNAMALADRKLVLH